MIYSRNTELMEAELGDELVALDPAGGQCFGFNPVAASVWKLLATPQPFDALKGALLEEYEVSDEQCDTELRALLADLVTQKLVRAEAR